MSLDSAKRKKVDAKKESTSPEDDHRKRRRNRTTQSCLNCHTSKRMCDRKRPCGRCTQLGLTGLCVYEVDDPSQSRDTADDKARLQKRVAELEGVIRELKQKPHPKWIKPSGAAAKSARDSRVPFPRGLDPNNATCQGEGDNTGLRNRGPHSGEVRPNGPASPLDSSMVRHKSTTPPSIEALRETSLPSLHSPSSQSPSPSYSSVHTPGSEEISPFFSASPGPPYKPAGDSVGSLLSYFSQLEAFEGDSFANLFDDTLREFASDRRQLGGFNHDHETHKAGMECLCLTQDQNYSVVLELSLRLRRAAETLSRYHVHTPGTPCFLQQRISELDNFTSSALGEVNSFGAIGTFHPNQSTMSPFAANGCQVPATPYSRSGYPTPSSTMVRREQMDFGGSLSAFDDGFMSWQPPCNNSR